MTQTPSIKTQRLQVGGMNCGGCAKTIEASLQQLPGVTETVVSFATEQLSVSYDPLQVNEMAIRDRITALGYTVDVTPAKTLQAQIGGMDCGGCAKTIAASLQQMTGVESASVNFAAGRLQVFYNPQQVGESAIRERITALGYTIEQLPTVGAPGTEDANSDSQNQAHSVVKPTQNPELTGGKFWLSSRRGQSVILAGVGIVLGLLTQYLALPIWIARAFYGIGIVVAGYPIARAGLFELRLRRADMNLLMTISVIGAVVLGDWFEGALVVFLFS